MSVWPTIRARVAAHNAGQALHTKKFRPWRLVTYVAFSDQAKAVAFERYEDRLRARLRQEASVLGPQGEGGP
jgi:predicted GIY-YIG superfamily endonuclease